MPSTTQAKNQMLDALSIDTIKLHNADPGTAGTTGQISGASSSCSFNAATNGERQLSADVSLSIPAGETVSHFSLWSGAIFLMSKAFTVPETYANAGAAVIQAVSTKITLQDV